MAISTKAQAIKIVTECVQDYKNNLVNKKTLFVVTDKNKRTSFFEVSFDASNFLHLTGLKVDERSLSPIKFYERCLDKKITENDFEFASDGTTPLKLEVLPLMMKKSLSANALGEYNHRQPFLYTEKLTGGVRGCMGFVQDRNTNKYYPNTVLQADIRDYVKEVYRIVATFQKEKDENQYSELVYMAKKVDWNKIQFPKGYEYLLQIEPIKSATFKDGENLTVSQKEKKTSVKEKLKALQNKRPTNSMPRKQKTHDRGER